MGHAREDEVVGEPRLPGHLRPGVDLGQPVPDDGQRTRAMATHGRDFRPLEVIPLTPGFGEQRLRQNGRQDALYVFDRQVDVRQPLTLSYERARNDGWADVLPQIERERALVKSRAAAGRVPDGRD